MTVTRVMFMLVTTHFRVGRKSDIVFKSDTFGSIHTRTMTLPNSISDSRLVHQLLSSSVVVSWEKQRNRFAHELLWRVLLLL